MNRDRALTISDTLAAEGHSHEISVGARDGLLHYAVKVTPVLVFEPMKITELQRIADRLGCQISFCNGSFIFVEGSA